MNIPELLAPAIELNQFLPDFKKAYKDVAQKSTKAFDGYVQLQFFNSNGDEKWSEKATHATINEINNAIAEPKASPSGRSWVSIKTLSMASSSFESLSILVLFVII